jgi:hypothetical protein
VWRIACATHWLQSRVPDGDGLQHLVQLLLSFDGSSAFSGVSNSKMQLLGNDY